MASGAACDPGDLLTVEQFREHHPKTRLTDDAICRILRDAAAAIRASWGDPVEVDRVEVVRSGWWMKRIQLARPADTIASVVESAIEGSTTTTTLAANDYAVSEDGLYLVRLSSGTHPRHHWNRTVTVTYDTADATDAMIGMQLALAALAVQFDGTTSHSSPQEGEVLPDFAASWAAILARAPYARPLF